MIDRNQDSLPVPLGLSGRIAATFQDSAITPLLAIVGLLLGVFAVLVTPKEEEPQIEVTFADVFIPFEGASPAQVESLVTAPAEQLISELSGVDSSYSFSMANGVMIIVVFEVGKPRNDAIVSLYNQFYSNLDRLPQLAGVGPPLIKPRSIDDVPVLAITLWSDNSQRSHQDLTQIAQGLETELSRISGTREIKTVGARPLIASVRLDPIKINGFGINYSDIERVLADNNSVSAPVGWVQDNQQIRVQAGNFLDDPDQLRQLVIGVHDGSAVYLDDVAAIDLGGEIPDQIAWHHDKQGLYPAVTIAISKQAGVNAVDLSRQVQARLAAFANILIPDDVDVTISRDYGKTAGDKANTLIAKLIFATLAVVFLVLLTMGWREALIVGIAIAITLALTLFASWAYGFTLNRISLFALIFSIGILVDDAIVVVENIHRHLLRDRQQGLATPVSQLISQAVDEVGGPTILATLTVIAALLPMAFVSGLMGPYMGPIPINASMGMLISLAVAFVLSPWLSRKLLAPTVGDQATANKTTEGPSTDEPVNDKVAIAGSSPPNRLDRLFRWLIMPLLHSRLARWGLWAGLLLLIAAAVSLPLMQQVVMKMLPFDNKSEFQVLVDLPEGAPIEMTQRLQAELAERLAQSPEVASMQLYTGTSAPINFNGLVRHYDMRNSAELGDIQVNLVAKSERDRDSHTIAQSLRADLQALAKPYDGNIKIIEVPPGPPVWSPIVAEVYGPTQEIRELAAQQLLQQFRDSDDIVDIDIMLPQAQQQWRLQIDRQRAARLGISYSEVVALVETSIGGKDVSVLHLPRQKRMVPIRLQLDEASKVDLEALLMLRLKAHDGSQVPLSELVTINKGVIDTPIVHKNSVPTVILVADMAGRLDSPLYGMAEVLQRSHEQGVEQHLISQPTGVRDVAVLWDGEWKITYETFRDMGIAYAVGMILIYLLVVAQFRSYLAPLIIMAPIPLTVIGVLPGHWLLGAQFTATSMIGMIALAGILVRNSILLVDFINHQSAQGVAFERAVINASAVRAKPIILTALAAMIGALFILDDPIFNGLAISLIFGILVSTVLTLVVIPVLYYRAFRSHYGAAAGA
ncbi:MAG: efflux RND transporter permease subunit [Motiliproteus sp.]